MTKPPPRNDLEEIHRAIQLLFEPGQVSELRAFTDRRGTVNGYFDDFERLARNAANISGNAPAVYVMANPVLPDLLARSVNRVKTYVRDTTTDAQIVTRRWLLIDFDAEYAHKLKISSTEAERELALARAIETRDWLVRCGWPAGILADSGNGGHVLQRVDLPNDADSTTLLKGCLQALSFRYDDAAVKVDTGNFNAARIWKLYGTLAAKGDSTAERPHRIARILDAPDPVEVVPLSLLQALAHQAPPPPPAPPRRTYRGNGEHLDLERWITTHNISIHHAAPWNGGMMWVLTHCIWDETHTNLSAYMIQFPNGGIAAGCHHNSCQGKGWTELREAVEPGYRDRRSSAGGAYKRHGRVYIPRVEV